jgi:acyl carrier protein
MLRSVDCDAGSNPYTLNNSRYFPELFMTDSELIEIVNSVFTESFEIPPEKLKPEAQIFGELGLDSLDVVDLVAAIQKKFAVQVRDDERVRAIRTLQDLYNYLILIRTEQNKG